MPVTAVVGAQWGDEAKGRIIDYIAAEAKQADMVIRFQGGSNAGHTVINPLGTFKLNLVPSGIFNPATRCIVGPGTVVNPAKLLTEMENLAKVGIRFDNFYISDRAQVVMPYHLLLDELEEGTRGEDAIGTTKQGVGPAYADKASRIGIRVGDLTSAERLRPRLMQALARKNALLEHVYDRSPLDPQKLLAETLAWGERLQTYIADTLPMVQEAVTKDERVLLEGQLGVMRDIDWGIYPYVTSSAPTAAGACAGAGIPPNRLNYVLGVVKAYSTAVGAGPMPTELQDAMGERIRTLGKEFGAVTGRPRRCGWFDGVAIRQASWLNGFSGLAVTKLDVLDTLPELQICVAYDVDGEIIQQVPDTYTLERAKPVYEQWAGWQTDTTQVRQMSGLPKAARAYLDRISELAGTPIEYVSVGPERSEMFAAKS